MEQENPVDEAYVNALLYGVGVVLMHFDGRSVTVRTVPRSEYEELGQALTEFPESVNMEDKK
jgi:hypothetical protein